jgi:hypothetical protein
MFAYLIATINACTIETFPIEMRHKLRAAIMNAGAGNMGRKTILCDDTKNAAGSVHTETNVGSG